MTLNARILNESSTPRKALEPKVEQLTMFVTSGASRGDRRIAFKRRAFKIIPCVAQVKYCNAFATLEFS